MSRVIAPEDVRAVLASPLVMTATDTYAVDRPLDPSMALHPRTYAAYPRFLARHIREQRMMPLHEAIWRMTGYPADRFRLKDCGRLAEGRAADVIVFDPATIADLATLTDPYRGATGIGQVFVNGVEVVTDGGPPTPGRVGSCDGDEGRRHRLVSEATPARHRHETPGELSHAERLLALGVGPGGPSEQRDELARVPEARGNS